MRLDVVFLSYIALESVLRPNMETTDDWVLGGPAAYGTMTVSELGGKSAVVSSAGEDMMSELWEPLVEANINLEGVKIVKKSTRSKLQYHRDGTKSQTFPMKGPEIRGVDIPDSYLSARAAWFCPMSWEIALSALKKFAEANVICGADLGGFGGAHSGPATQRFYDSREDLSELIQFLNIVRLSDEDATHLFGRHMSSHDVLGRLLDLGAEVAILTKGHRGAIALERQGKETRVSPPVCLDANPTGAGDAFSASFLYEYIRTQSVEQSIRFASAVAALVVSRPGGVQVQRFPSREEVEDFLDSQM